MEKIEKLLVEGLTTEIRLRSIRQELMKLGKEEGINIDLINWEVIE